MHTCITPLLQAAQAAARLPGAPAPTTVLKPNILEFQKRLTARITHARDLYELRDVLTQYEGERGCCFLLGKLSCIRTDAMHP